MHKQWTLLPSPPKAFFETFPDLPDLVVRLLYHRGLTTQDAVDEFLNPDYGEDIHDPFLFRDMEKAVERLRQAREKKEKIVIHGDYDADGVCASAILHDTLTFLGAQSDVFLPHRETEGYGLNMQTIELLHHDGTNVMITCDCGISNGEEVARAQELGMDVIITDHHTIPKNLPNAYAIIHPKVEGETYPFRDLSGGGVAFKLASALVKRLGGEDTDAFLKWQLDCVAISTIADMVPLLGENRTLVRYGLVVLEKTRRPGLAKLLEVAGLRRPIDPSTIGFGIAPRLNAAGRMNHANAAYALLVTRDDAEATRLAEELNTANRERQRVTKEMFEEARQRVREEGQDRETTLVVAQEGWPLSLAGLVASKLVEEYARPAFVLTKKEQGWMGSGRSTKKFDLMQAMQQFQNKTLAKFGGHPQACGFTLADNETPASFAKAMRAASDAALRGQEFAPEILLDAEIQLSRLSWDVYDVLQRFEPFGIGNPKPLYVARGLHVTVRNELGQNGNHLRLSVEDREDGKRWKAMAFGKAEEFSHIQPGDTVDCAFEVAVDQWNGNRELMLRIVDIQKI